MKRMFLVCAAVFLSLAVTIPVVAQKRPDFSGTWVEDEAQRKSPFTAKPSTTGGAKSLSAGEPNLVVEQTPTALTVQRTFVGQTTRMTYSFDGKENVNHTGAQTHTTRTRWEGEKLVTEGSVYQVTSAGEDSWKLREVRWLTPKGELAYETIRTDEDGKTTTVLRVYRKK